MKNKTVLTSQAKESAADLIIRKDPLYVRSLFRSMNATKLSEIPESLLPTLIEKLSQLADCEKNSFNRHKANCGVIEDLFVKINESKSDSVNSEMYNLMISEYFDRKRVQAYIDFCILRFFPYSSTVIRLLKGVKMAEVAEMENSDAQTTAYRKRKAKEFLCDCYRLLDTLMIAPLLE